MGAREISWKPVCRVTVPVHIHADGYCDACAYDDRDAVECPCISCMPREIVGDARCDAYPHRASDGGLLYRDREGCAVCVAQFDERDAPAVPRVVRMCICIEVPCRHNPAGVDVYCAADWDGRVDAGEDVGDCDDGDHCIHAAGDGCCWCEIALFV